MSDLFNQALDDLEGVVWMIVRTVALAAIMITSATATAAAIFFLLM